LNKFIKFVKTNSDVTIYAGSAIMTVKSTDKVKLLTVRGTAFPTAKLNSATKQAEIVNLKAEQTTYD
jgi:electron transfer flavoprotein alpha subunit